MSVVFVVQQLDFFVANNMELVSDINTKCIELGGICPGCPGCLSGLSVLRSKSSFLWLFCMGTTALNNPFRRFSAGRKDNGTITHTDFRLENLFFTKEGSGPNGAKTAAFIDFQLMGSGTLATMDIMYFLMNSVPTEWRRENELALLNAYYDKLIESPYVQEELYPCVPRRAPAGIAAADAVGCVAVQVGRLHAGVPSDPRWLHLCVVTPQGATSPARHGLRTVR